MATTLIPGTAIITTSIVLTIAGVERNVTVTKSIASIADYDARVVDVPTAIVDLLTVGAAAPGKGTLEGFNFLIVINRDDTNFVRLRISESGGVTADQRLDAGDWMMLWNDKLSVDLAEGPFVAFNDWDTVTVQADTAPVQLEYLIIEV